MRLLARILEFLFGRKTAPHRAAPEPHALDLLCQQYDATYQRTPFPTGEVQITLIRPDATLSAVGLTTAEAVQKLTAKAHACWRDM